MRSLWNDHDEAFQFCWIAFISTRCFSLLRQVRFYTLSWLFWLEPWSTVSSLERRCVHAWHVIINLFLWQAGLLVVPPGLILGLGTITWFSYRDSPGFPKEWRKKTRDQRHIFVAGRRWSVQWHAACLNEESAQESMVAAHDHFVEVMNESTCLSLRATTRNIDEHFANVIGPLFWILISCHSSHSRGSLPLYTFVILCIVLLNPFNSRCGWTRPIHLGAAWTHGEVCFPHRTGWRLYWRAAELGY